MKLLKKVERAESEFYKGIHLDGFAQEDINLNFLLKMKTKRHLTLKFFNFKIKISYYYSLDKVSSELLKHTIHWTIEDSNLNSTFKNGFIPLNYGISKFHCKKDKEKLKYTICDLLLEDFAIKGYKKTLSILKHS